MQSNWISVLRPATRGAQYRVLIVPHAGAGPNALAPLWECLPVDVEVAGVTLPGRERRFADGAAAVPDDPDDVIAAVLAEIAGLRPLPTVLFGHSLGAAIAAAVVDEQPAWFDSVVLSSYPAEGTAADRAGRWPTARLMEIVDAAGGTPAEVVGNPVWREFLLDLLRKDLTLGARLASRAVGPFPVPLTVLHGADDRLVARSDQAVWLSRAGAGLRMRTLPGGHFYLLDEPNRYPVADEIVSTFQSRSIAS